MYIAVNLFAKHDVLTHCFKSLYCDVYDINSRNIEQGIILRVDNIISFLIFIVSVKYVDRL